VRRLVAAFKSADKSAHSICLSPDEQGFFEKNKGFFEKNKGFFEKNKVKFATNKV
jgi:hypothetical protein